MMRLNLKTIILVLILASTGKAMANYPDFFGASASTMAIAAQASSDSYDPSNAFYAPALMGPNARLSFSANFSFVRHDFEDINNVVTQNSTNSSLGNQSGDVKTDYPDYRNLSLALNLPLAIKGAGNAVLTYNGPVGTVMESDSGHPTLPEYVLYKSRYKRSMINAHYIHPYEQFAFSLGATIGLQASADVGTQASLVGTGHGSSASAKSKVSPSVGAFVSAAFFHSFGQLYFAYTQEMKQYLHANTNGETSNPVVPFDVSVDSMLYYDPHTFRLGGSLDFDSISLFAALEYQIWDGYETPVVRITQRTGLESSSNYEKIKTKNIFVPHLAAKIHLTEHLHLAAGLTFRPTPFEGDFSGAGNSIDSDTWSLSAGPELRFKLFEKDWRFNAAMLYQKLEQLQVTKSTGQENGAGGNKIGSPGYKVGGEIWAATLGITLVI